MPYEQKSYNDVYIFHIINYNFQVFTFLLINTSSFNILTKGNFIFLLVEFLLLGLLLVDNPIFYFSSSTF